MDEETSITMTICKKGDKFSRWMDLKCQSVIARD